MRHTLILPMIIAAPRHYAATLLRDVSLCYAMITLCLMPPFSLTLSRRHDASCCYFDAMMPPFFSLLADAA